MNVLVCCFYLIAWAALAAPKGEEVPVNKLLESFQQQWSAADGHGIATLFEPDGDLVIPDGTRLSTRPQIEGFYSAVFDHGYRGSIGTAKLGTLRLVSAEVAVVDGSWEINGAHDSTGKLKPAEQGLFTAVLVKRNQQWPIFSLREMTPLKVR